ncbi:MAG: sigma-70 family RNA polymerase sigma factor [Planctomycetota bacterium]
MVLGHVCYDVRVTSPEPQRKPSPRKPGEYELMQRVAQNDEAAINELYDRFEALVFRMSYQTMPSRAEAEDAVQEVFIRLWKTADRYDPKRAALVTWVMLICRRHLVDRLRRQRARIKPGYLDESAAGSESPGEARFERDERLATLLKKLETLPELQRIVITRAYLGGQTLRQIGEELGTPLGTVKSALSRALVRLRERSSEELSA